MQDKIIYTFGVSPTEINASALSLRPMFAIHFVSPNPFILLSFCRSYLSLLCVPLAILSLSFRTYYGQNLYFFTNAFWYDGLIPF